jgi:hypothetical protein
MGQQSTPLNPTRFYRQDSKPPSASDGAVWVTNADGAGNDTSSRYVYNAEASRWELDSAVGPSEPDRGVPVAGAVWRDTANGTATQYDGTAFVNLGVTDHANLQNVTADQHFTHATVAGSGDHADLSGVGPDDHFDHATVAGTGDHADLTGIGSSDHHQKTTVEVTGTGNIQGNRSYGTTYTNNTGYPIFLSVVATNSTSPTEIVLEFNVDGNQVQEQYHDADSDFERVSATALVPSGSTYTVDCGVQISEWVEQEIQAL